MKKDNNIKKIAWEAAKVGKKWLGIKKTKIKKNKSKKRLVVLRKVQFQEP